MFPETQHSPTCLDQLAVGVHVALTVPPHLVGPEACVGLRGCVVVGAAVPEATVHEHRDLRAGEDQVSSTTQGRNRPI